jgi:hypothetical protein
MLFELCLCGVGGNSSAHPDYLENRLTKTQIIEWAAFYRIRPFGSKRDDLRAAVATYWSVSAAISEAPADHTPQKYMLKFNDAAPLNEAEEIMQRIRERMSR